LSARKAQQAQQAQQKQIQLAKDESTNTNTITSAHGEVQRTPHVQVKSIAAEVASQNCSTDLCFTKTLQAIAWQESSFGRNLVGDKSKIVYYYKDGHNRVHVPWSRVRESDKHMYAVVSTGDTEHKKQVFVDVKTKELGNTAVGAFQVKMQTAKRVIKEMGLAQYKHLLDNDTALIKKLALDARFSALIAVNYLKLNYEHAKSRNMSDPWFYAVSKYNGGSKNFTYVNLIKSKMGRLSEV
jgi:hypothetical protein